MVLIVEWSYLFNGLNSGVDLFFNSLNSRVVLFFNGLNSGLLLYTSGMKITTFILNIQAPQLLNILVLKFEQIYLTTCLCA